MEIFAEITLKSMTYEADDLGQMIPTPTDVAVMATKTSVSAAEFFRAGADGLKPEYVFKVWAHEYNNEDLIGYDGKLYSVYRRYHNDEGKVELYCERKVGNHVTESSTDGI